MSQNISEASHARDNPLQSAAATVRKVAACALPWLLAGCELVLGGIPEKPALDDGTDADAGDAAVFADAADAADTDAAVQAPPDAAVKLDARVQSVPDSASSAPRDATTSSPEEAGLVEDDAAVADASTRPDDAATRDAATVVDAGPTCTEPLWWYADRDADGYGVAADRSFVCPKPAGSWSSRAGDCNDADDRVHPGQLSYFGTPARGSNGADSFDFDCSGAEEGSGLQTPAPDSCGLLSLTACIGSGYAKTNRQGSGVDPLCGSAIQQTCQAAGLLGCMTTSGPVTEPYRCR
jgi:hypothetical protein